MSDIPEPPINPEDDTNPSLAVRPADGESLAGWQRTLGWLSLIGAAIFTLATVIILLLPPREAPLPETQQAPTAIAAATDSLPTAISTTTPETDLPQVQSASPEQGAVVVDPQQLANLLQAPVTVEPNMARVKLQYDPFTVIRGDRPRSQFLEYTAVQGDTINSVAARYNLAPESLAWCNDRRIIQVLRPNDVLSIPPVDGACHRVLGTREETIAQIATRYQVDDPYAIIDSPFNYPRLVGVGPDDVLPGGTNIFIPGGQGEAIAWNPGRETETNADGSVRTVTFAPGHPGSCGPVEPGGGTVWSNPIPTGTWMRGFYAGHTGLDIAAPIGTPLYAANGGRVIFAGWNRWGYGNTVVIEHGATLSTLYGHMESIGVSCGQFLSAGQVIGTVGNTGNSSGPHVHFEIRSGDTPMNPSGTPGIGW